MSSALPSVQFDPKFSYGAIMDYLELTNLGLFDSSQPVTFYHNKSVSQTQSSPGLCGYVVPTQGSELLDTLVTISSDIRSNMVLRPSGRDDLPVGEPSISHHHPSPVWDDGYYTLP